MKDEKLVSLCQQEAPRRLGITANPCSHSPGPPKRCSLKLFLNGLNCKLEIIPEPTRLYQDLSQDTNCRVWKLELLSGSSPFSGN